MDLLTCHGDNSSLTDGVLCWQTCASKKKKKQVRMDYQNGLQGLGDPEVDFEGQHFLLESQFSQKWECSDHVVFCWFKFRLRVKGQTT